MGKGVTPGGLRFAFVHSSSEKAQLAYKSLVKAYGQCEVRQADVLVALGGDGFLLETLGRYGTKGHGVFGMNRGSEGFLLNDFRVNNLRERLDQAIAIKLYRLSVLASNIHGKTITAKAINEVSLFRQTIQTAQLCVCVDGVVRLPQLVCDGLMMSTPAGSTAYNLSADGPILPLDANLIALTPIAAFRPRRWRGALLHRNVKVTIEAQDIEKRPVAVAADGYEIRDVAKVFIETDRRTPLRLLFDHEKPLQERVLYEQFSAY